MSQSGEEKSSGPPDAMSLFSVFLSFPSRFHQDVASIDYIRCITLCQMGNWSSVVQLGKKKKTKEKSTKQTINQWAKRNLRPIYTMVRWSIEFTEKQALSSSLFESGFCFWYGVVSPFPHLHFRSALKQPFGKFFHWKRPSGARKNTVVKVFRYDFPEFHFRRASGNSKQISPDFFGITSYIQHPNRRYESTRYNRKGCAEPLTLLTSRAITNSYSW